MSYTGYLFITGERQDEIETTLDADGKEGAIPFYRFKHKIGVPEVGGMLHTDGLPYHGIIEVAKQFDETTPKLYRALCTREKLTDVSFKWFEYEDGVESLIYEIELEDCRILDITSESSVLDENFRQIRIGETLSIQYRRIRWQYGDETELSYDCDTTSVFEL